MQLLIDNLDLMTFYSDWAALFLRLVLAGIFFLHGIQKIKNYKNISEAVGMANKKGFFLFLGIVETLGAVSLAIGFLTQLSALGLALIMLGAVYYKIFKWKIPFAAMDKTGWEFDLALLSALLMVAFGGAGEYSADYQYFT